MNNSPQRAAKGFTRAFWVSNTVELFERMAYYAVFIVLTIYLSSILGFNDFEASMISGLFSGGLYLLPIFSGAYADKIGFRKSMIIAFSLLSIGYLGLGVFPTLLEAAGLVSYGVTTQFNGLPDSYTRWIIVPVLFVLMVGGSFIKSIISASVDAVVVGDKKRIIQIGSNLLSNAIKFTEQGTVTLRTRFEKGILALTVEDTGTGMDDEEQARIFTAFERLPNAIAEEGV